MVSRQAEGNQDFKYLHYWCKEVQEEIVSEKRHLAQRVEAEGGKSSVPEFPCLPTFSGPEEIRMLGLASAPQESPDSEIVL